MKFINECCKARAVGSPLNYGGKLPGPRMGMNASGDIRKLFQPTKQARTRPGGYNATLLSRNSNVIRSADDCVNP